MNKPSDELFGDLNPEDTVEALDAMLRDHAERAVERAIDKMGGVLSGDTLPTFLQDGDCLRCPTEIVYSDEGLDPHQFAEPFYAGPEDARQCTLHVASRFESYPQFLALFVAYMAPVINYGDIANEALCERYGAGLLGLEPEVFYEQLCAAFDAVPHQP